MDITLLSTIIVDLSIVVGVIFAIIQIRQATKTQNTGLVIQLNPALRADIGELIDASNILFQQEFTSYEDYQEKYGDPWADKALLTLLAYNDGLGYLLQKRLIDREIVENLSEGMITSVWEKLQPIITGMRKHYPDLHSSFEYLYNELKKT